MWECNHRASGNGLWCCNMHFIGNISMFLRDLCRANRSSKTKQFGRQKILPTYFCIHLIRYLLNEFQYMCNETYLLELVTSGVVTSNKLLLVSVKHNKTLNLCLLSLNCANTTKCRHNEIVQGSHVKGLPMPKYSTCFFSRSYVDSVLRHYGPDLLTARANATLFWQ